MQIGYLYQKKEKEVKEDIEKGQEVELGVSCNSLLDTINVHEINFPSEPFKVLGYIKQEVMHYLGKIQETKKNE